MITIFDLETSDLPHKELPWADPGQPWITQIAAEIMNYDGKVFDYFSFHIRAEGRKIRPGAEAVHGVSSRHAQMHGLRELRAFSALVDFAEQSEFCVSYGDFDRDVFTMNLMRLEKPVRIWNRPGLEFIDLKRACTAQCKLPFAPNADRTWESGEYRWPSLSKAAEIILGEPADSAQPIAEPAFHSSQPHDAGFDQRRASRLFLECWRRGLIDVGGREPPP